MHQTMLFSVGLALAAASADEAAHQPGRMMRTEIRSEGDLHEEESMGSGTARGDVWRQVPELESEDCPWSQWTDWRPCDATCGNDGSSKTTRSRRLMATDQVLAETCGSGQEERPCQTTPCPTDCVWNDWQGWSECSTTCGHGQKFNKRTRIQAQYGGLDCAGAFEKITDCRLENCTSTNECTWTEWDDWHGCQHTCGGGSETRKRTVLTLAANGKTCDAPCNELRDCAQGECPVDCLLGDWTPWASCSVSCGEGRMRRTRPVENQMAHGGSACGPREESEICNKCECPAICAFSDWSDWGACSVTCGTGTYTRSKSIAAKSVADSHCVGTAPKEDQTCCEASCSNDCYASDWSSWSTCSATCGTGFSERYRIFHQSSEGGRACEIGSGTYESIHCSVQSTCPRDFRWDDWGDWSCCSASCGDGQSTRTRAVFQEAIGDGNQHEGDPQQQRDCNVDTCPTHCQWGLWSDWSTCWSSCGTGNQSRTRTVQTAASYGGEPCEGGSDGSQSCSSGDCPVDCTWLDWSAWGECSSSCGHGTLSRSRNKTNARSGGLECKGATKEAKDCEALPDCPKDCVWSAWSDWGQCSVTCGAGTERKLRLRKSYESGGGKICQGAEDDERLCSSAACPQDCQLGDWEAWTACTATCGVGTRSRSRAIIQHEQLGGLACPVSTTSGNSSVYEVTGCFHGGCASDCVWSEWSPWTICTKSCGGGYTSRDRKELGQAANGGRTCSGSAHEETLCSVSPCPVDCIWDSWADWSNCSTTCGGGERARERQASRAAQHGGADCSGLAKEKDLCNTLKCPINCQWSTWTTWTPCSVTCAGGETHRSRRKLVLEQHDGLACIGDSSESVACNSEGCPVDCEWGPWSKWTACSATCAGGSIKRVRDISVHKKNNGSDCLGPFEQTADCNNNPCPGSCVWGDWSPWPCCPVSCGGASKVSTRERLQEAFAGGAPCAGNSTREEFCNTQSCPFDCHLQDWSDWSACSVSCGLGVKARSRVKNQERDGGKACNEPLSQINECPNEENSPFCPVTTSTTTLNIVYVVAEDGQDPLVVAGLKAATPKPADDDTSKAHDTSKALKPADDTMKPSKPEQTTSMQPPKPCITNQDLKAALDSYPSKDAQHIIDAIATLKTANEKAMSETIDVHKGKKVSDLITHLHLYAENADDFITSIAANAALTKAMSKLLIVDEKNIKAEMTLEGAFMTPTWKKQEQGNVKADVTVQIFENDNIGDVKLLADGMASLTADKVTAAIQKQLTEADLGQFQVHATSMSVS